MAKTLKDSKKAKQERAKSGNRKPKMEPFNKKIRRNND